MTANELILVLYFVVMVVLVLLTSEEPHACPRRGFYARIR